MAELTDNGLVGKTQNEYFNDEQQLYLNIDSEWNLDPSTPDGVKIASDSELLGNFDELLYLIYASKDPNQAQGRDLDILSALTGTVRSPGTRSQMNLEFYGVAGSVVEPAVSQYEAQDGRSSWNLTQSVTLLGPTTPAVGVVESVALGAVSANTNTVTRITVSQPGLQRVTNPAPPFELGQEPQSDSSLRLERSTAVSRPGSNQVDNMAGEILAVDGVTSIRIYENDTDSPDSNGVPARSLAIYVIGGADGDIARSIYIKKNPGVALWEDPGATSVTLPVTSPTYAWNTKDITFNRPAQIAITVVVDITDDGSLPVSVDQEIIDNILAYAAGGEPAAECGFNNSGFGVSEDVTYSRMYTPVNKVIGSYGNSFITNLTINGGTSNITINFNQISQWLAGNITVNIT